MPVTEENISKAVDFLQPKLSEEDLATFEELARSYVADDDEVAADGVSRSTPLIRLARRSALARRAGGMASDSRSRSHPRAETEAERMAFDKEFPHRHRLGAPETFGMPVPRRSRPMGEADRRKYEALFPHANRLK